MMARFGLKMMPITCHRGRRPVVIRRRNGKTEQSQTGLLGYGLCRQPLAQGMPDLRQLNAELNRPALDPTLNVF